MGSKAEEIGGTVRDNGGDRNLGLDGYFIMFFNVHLDRYQLILSDKVRNVVPSTWDLPALARYEE